jgi:hypothetical protein
MRSERIRCAKKRYLNLIVSGKVIGIGISNLRITK